MKHLVAFLVLFNSLAAVARTISLRDTTNQYDYIIITVPEFKSTCEPFNQHKQGLFGYKVLIADTTMIYSEFSAYPNKEDNIREFISFAGTYWRFPQPKYFLIAGDIRKIPNHKVALPPGPNPTEPTDFFYSNNIYTPDTLATDFFIGRVPALNNLQLQNYLNKVIQYESNLTIEPWNNRAMVIGEYDNGWRFDSTALALNPSFPSFISLKNYTMGGPDTGYFGNRDSIISYLNNTGSSSVWLVGLSSNGVTFGQDSDLTFSDIELLQTNAKYFVSGFIARQKMAKDSLLSFTDKLILDEDGSIGSFGFTGPSLYAYSTEFMKMLINNLYSEPNKGIGSKLALIQYPIGSLMYYYQREILNLWGDPSLRLIFDPTTTIRNNESEKPSEFNLLQNFPNPFNPSTKISFTLQNASDVQIIVFDVLGNEVSVLTDEFYEAGFHSVDFNIQSIGREISSGAYFYTIKAGDFIQSKKMLFLK